jgi:hypothetical protein
MLMLIVFLGADSVWKWAVLLIVWRNVTALFRVEISKLSKWSGHSPTLSPSLSLSLSHVRRERERERER